MLDEEEVRAVLADAEEGTALDVRVAVEEDPELDLDAHAFALWRELDLDDVGVLVLIATGRREIRVVAGPRLLAEVDDAFWQDAADQVAAGFRDGDPAGGLRRALAPVRELGLRVAPVGGPSS